MDEDSARSIKTCRSAGVRREDECSTSQQGAAPTNDGRTRSTKRKASPEKKMQEKKRRISEVPEPSNKSRVRRGKRKGREDEEGPSEKTKKRRGLDLNNYIKLSASTSVDTGRECSISQQSAAPTIDGRTRSTKRKESPEKETLQKKRRISEVPEPCKKSRVRSRKRKGGEDEEEPSENTQKRRRPDFNNYNNESASMSVDTGRENSSTPLQGCSRSVNGVIKRSNKRKVSTDGEGPSRKKKRSPDQEEDLSVDAQRAKFEAKYTQLHQLGKGGCGYVFAGYCNADDSPVAIKHIPKDNVTCKTVDQNGRELSIEVDIMLKLTAGKTGSSGMSAPVSLLDWYDLGQELILVLERPIPCEDLFSYKEANGGTLQEEEAKIILKQLIDATIELQNQHIFHRDIKLENILIETGSDFPCVRLIDFGLSCFTKETSSYNVFCGTVAQVPPEWYRRFTYSAGPTTVWQLGVVLFEMLHRVSVFETTKFLTCEQDISNELSTNCQDFLEMCLAVVPEQRPTLEQLQLHPWLN